MNLVELSPFDSLPNLHAWRDQFNYRTAHSFMIMDGASVVQVRSAVVNNRGRTPNVVVATQSSGEVTLEGDEIHERLHYWKPEYGYYNTRHGTVRVQSTEVSRPYRHGLHSEYIRVRGVQSPIEGHLNYSTLLQEVFDNYENFVSVEYAQESGNFVAITRHMLGSVVGVLLLGERRPVPWDVALSNEDIVTDIEYEAGGAPCLVR